MNGSANWGYSGKCVKDGETHYQDCYKSRLYFSDII